MILSQCPTSREPASLPAVGTRKVRGPARLRALIGSGAGIPGTIDAREALPPPRQGPASFGRHQPLGTPKTGTWSPACLAAGLTPGTVDPSRGCSHPVSAAEASPECTDVGLLIAAVVVGLVGFLLLLCPDFMLR